MTLWRRKRRDQQAQAGSTSDKQRLEQLLYRLADIIGEHDETDRFGSDNEAVLR